MLTIQHRSYPVKGKKFFEGSCLSTDQKPIGDNIYNGSQLLEMDTSTLYVYDAENQVWRAWEQCLTACLT